jgi:type I restriction enzyme S subunit
VQSDWKTSTLKRCLSSLKDGTHGTFERTLSGVPLLSAKNIATGRLVISASESQISWEDYQEIDKNGYLQKGDLLLTIVGSLGNSAIFDIDEPVAFQRSVACLRFKSQNLTRFFFYLTQSAKFQADFLARAKKSAQSGVYLGDLGAIPVTYPGLADQRPIADFLDREAAKVDDLIAKKELLIERLKEIRRSTISRLATMGTCHTVTTKDSGIPCIGQIPSHWQLLRNKNILREIDDRSCDGTEELLTVSHITGVSPRRENQQVTMFMAESNEGYKRCLPNDIVINTMWAWMGALGVSIYAGLVSPAYNVYRFKQKADPWYFHHLFRSPQYVAEIGRYSRGVWTSRLRLYPEEFLNMTSPVPPLEEQSKIASLIDEQNKAASRESAMITSALALLREYRAALISAAVTGQLDLRHHEAQLEALA